MFKAERIALSVVVPLLGSILACSVGCDRSDSNPPTSPSVPRADVASEGESDITVLWAAGKKDDVLKRFTEIEWNNYHPNQKLSIFTVTEKEYVALPESDRKVIDNRVQSLRELARYALDQGTAAAAHGDGDTARRYYTAVRDCGVHFVSDEQTLAVMKLVGRALRDKGTQALGK